MRHGTALTWGQGQSCAITLDGSKTVLECDLILLAVRSGCRNITIKKE
jgi:hypothetical protein